MLTSVVAIGSGAFGAEVAGSTVVFWTGVALVGLCLFVGATFRVVGRDSRAVVSRSDRVDRVTGPGVVFHVPGFETLTMVSLRAHDVPLLVKATTKDHVTVRLLAAATVQVTEPGASVVSADPVNAAALAVEDALRREVARLDLADLLPARTDLESRLPTGVSKQMAPLGVGVARIEVAEIETALSPRLLQVARPTEPAGAEEPAPCSCGSSR